MSSTEKSKEEIIKDEKKLIRIYMQEFADTLRKGAEDVEEYIAHIEAGETTYKDGVMWSYMVLRSLMAHDNVYHMFGEVIRLSAHEEEQKVIDQINAEIEEDGGLSNRNRSVTKTCADGERRVFMTPFWLKKNRTGYDDDKKYECCHCGELVKKPLKAHVCKPFSGGRHKMLHREPIPCAVCGGKVSRYYQGKNIAKDVCDDCGFEQTVTV